MTGLHEVHLVTPGRPTFDRDSALLEAGFVIKETVRLPDATPQTIFTKHCQSAHEGKQAFDFAVGFVERTPDEPALVEWETVRSRYPLLQENKVPLPFPSHSYPPAIPLKSLACTELRGRRKSADVHVKLMRAHVSEHLLDSLHKSGFMIIETCGADYQPPRIVFSTQFQGSKWPQWSDAAAAILCQFVFSELRVDASLKVESVVGFHLTRAHDDIPLASPLAF